MLDLRLQAESLFQQKRHQFSLVPVGWSPTLLLPSGKVRLDGDTPATQESVFQWIEKPLDECTGDYS
jgi:hypothetical protein